MKIFMPFLVDRFQGAHMRPGERGFTMIELLVTLSIAVIMLTVAVPSFQSLLLQSRLTSHTNELVLGMAYAKSEAVKRGVSVSVCASSDASTCSGTWQNGWIVRTNDGQVLQVQTAYTGSICANATSIVFLNSGFPSAAITFRLYDSRGTASGRTITVSALGRAVTSTGATACS
jgi:type IV fimbrial biogenesis protein FimT